MAKEIKEKEWKRLAQVAHFHPGELATLAGISQRQLYRRIVKAFGCSPREWISRIRFESCEKLLLAGGQVKGVAESTSFNHSSSFCRWFRHQKRRNAALEQNRSEYQGAKLHWLENLASTNRCEVKDATGHQL